MFTTCDTGGAGKVNHSRANEFTPGFLSFTSFAANTSKLLFSIPEQLLFLGALVPQSLVFYVVFCMLLYVLCAVVIILSVLRFIPSDCPFGIFNFFFV